MMDSSSLSIPVPNMIASSPSGGRFDFDDGGVYCGGWQDGKAHGHGVCTGPKNVGEYSGSWNFGFEMSGVYKWKNGAVYEGRWQNGKRHGVGVEYNGKWIYKGEWSQGFKGRYGVKASSNSAVKYEGTWANGLQDGYGSETYSDGGYYQGQMCRGLRHGYGVRKSAPYGDSQLNNPAKSNGANPSQQLSQMGASSSMMIHSNSLQSSNSVDIAISDDDSPKLDDGFKPNIDRTLASKNGFVLVAKPLDCTLPKQLATTSSSSVATNILGDSINSFSKSSSNRRNSLTNRLASAAASRIPGSNHSSSSAAAGSSIFRGLRGLRKQKSTSDLADQPLGGGGARSSASRVGSAAASELQSGAAEALVPFTLSPEELDITDPTTVETYTGEWKQDKRNGHGVCERSDGLKYEGQWHNDMKCGYGMTTFKDGTKEEGKYKNNILIADSKVKRFLHFGSSNIRQRIDDAIKMAHQAQTMALKKAEIADTRAATARDKADQATTAALEADRDSQIAFSVARQYSSDSQQQLGMNFATQPALSSILAMQDYGSQMPMQPAFNHGPAGSHQMAAASINHPNALQMRRASHHQHQQQYNRFAPSYDHDAMMQQQQQDSMDQQHQMDQQQQMGQLSGPKQFLAAVEPFNGRRGSFRGGSHTTQFNLPGGGGGGGGGRSSPFSPSGSGGGGGSSQLSHQHQQQQHHHPYQQAQSMGLNRQSSASDPFSDLFDHYKSSPAAGPDGFNLQQQQQQHGIRSRNRMLSRQTSLDVAGPRGLQQQQQQRGAMQRMSSMDHAEENHQQRHTSLEPNNMEQQLRHLVTSGEELGQSDSADRTAGGGGPTPSNSSYILAGQSSQNTNSQNSSSSFYGGGGGAANQASPSPDAQSGNTAGPTSSSRPPAGQSRYYSYQQPASNYPTQHAAIHSQVRQQQQQHFYNDQHSRQRDAQSLADDQLYAAGSRRMFGAHQMDPTMDEGEFSHYDFVISSAPRMARRVMRRTNSLSRNTPIRSISEFRHSTQQFETSTNNSLINLRQRSASPAAASNRAAFQQQQHQLAGVSSITVTTEPPAPGLNPNQTSSTSGNQQHQQQTVTDAHSPTSHLTVDSSLSAGSSTASAHARKPSLQVRYNPDELGGLMSREEVAALSHAQREQKRLEVELAESRAKRPLLHLYLSIKEFLIERKLLLSVLMINICLFEMFANLIV